MVKQLLNTLYVQRQGSYVHLHQDAVSVVADGERLLRVPLHHIGAIGLFGNVSVSPFLIHRCSEDGRVINWFTETGRFMGRLSGPTHGNVLLRQAQYRMVENDSQTLALAKIIVAGKLQNSKVQILRTIRDHGDPAGILEKSVEQLDGLLGQVDEAGDLDTVRGIEGRGAAVYFHSFSAMIRVDDGAFKWSGRNRRPPRDPINALLSFGYALLTVECASALEGVGLDPQAGYLHAIKPGRPALALDLAEEFRSIMVDRMVLAMVNRRQLQADDFIQHPGGAVVLTDAARRTFLEEYQRRKREEVTHPLLQEKVPMGLLMHVQARLLARYIRGDAPVYRPYVAR